ncbi:hypothetical protein FQA39_LY09273 [Lamprigera yunnana]|nr:hypothetical protein FQA39_LY09273 [Lamprigera yunnana]
MGQSIYNITYSEDHDRMRLHIASEDLLSSEWRKYFNVRLKRAGPRSETPVYETVSFMGMQRSNSNERTEAHNGSNSKDVVSSTTNNDVLVFFVKLSRPEPIFNRLIEATKDEYVTRHLVDGRITTADQRISYVAGYMTEEVSGISAFKFMHRDDVRWVMIALRQMYDRGESRGSSCYRLLSRTGQFIFLKTFGFLEIDNTGTVESFVCINSLVSEEEGMKLIREMKERYSALIKADAPLPITKGGADSSVQSVEDPQELELAIAHLVTNLPLSPGSECRSTPSPQSAFESQDCQNSQDRHRYSPNLPQPLRIKTVLKRPPSTDLGTNLYKRRKAVSEHIHIQSSPPYQRPIVEDIADALNLTPIKSIEEYRDMGLTNSNTCNHQFEGRFRIFDENFKEINVDYRDDKPRFSKNHFERRKNYIRFNAGYDGDKRADSHLSTVQDNTQTENKFTDFHDKLKEEEGRSSASLVYVACKNILKGISSFCMSLSNIKEAGLTFAHSTYTTWGKSGRENPRFSPTLYYNYMLHNNYTEIGVKLKDTNLQLKKVNQFKKSTLESEKQTRPLRQQNKETSQRNWKTVCLFLGESNEKTDQLKANFINFNIMQPNEYVEELNSENIEKKHGWFMPSCRHENGCRESDAFGKSVKRTIYSTKNMKL